MGIGKTLLDVLYERNENPNGLAEKVGVAPSTIYSIIRRDNMKVDISLLAKICDVLNVSMERFYNDYISEKKADLQLSAHEKRLILSYRKKPELQPAIDKLLEIETEEATIKIAARNGDYYEADSKETEDKFSEMPPVDDLE